MNKLLLVWSIVASAAAISATVNYAQTVLVYRQRIDHLHKALATSSATCLTAEHFYQLHKHHNFRH